MAKKKENNDSNNRQMTIFELIENSEEVKRSDPIWEKPELYLNTPEISTKSPKDYSKKRKRKSAEKSEEIRKPATEETQKDSGKSDDKAKLRKTKLSKPKKLKKSELKEYSKKVLEEYDVIRIGGIMRCCRISSTEAQQVFDYMEEEGMTVVHKKPKSGKKWEVKA